MTKSGGANRGFRSTSRLRTTSANTSTDRPISRYPSGPPALMYSNRLMLPPSAPCASSEGVDAEKIIVDEA